MNKIELIEKLCYFVDKQLSSLSQTNPIISVTKPILSRVLHNKIDKASNIFDLIATPTGNIDAKSIVEETIESILNTQAFNVNVPMLGDVIIGNGNIKFNIPLTDKSVVFNENDFNELKSIING